MKPSRISPDLSPALRGKTPLCSTHIVSLGEPYFPGVQDLTFFRVKRATKWPGQHRQVMPSQAHLPRKSGEAWAKRTKGSSLAALAEPRGRLSVPEQGLVPGGPARIGKNLLGVGLETWNRKRWVH